MFNIELANPDITQGSARWVYVSISKKADPTLVKEVLQRMRCLKNVMICTYDQSHKYDRSDLITASTCIVIPPAPNNITDNNLTHILGRGVFSEIEFFRENNIPVYVVAGINEGILVNEVEALVAKPDATDWNRWGYVRVNRTEIDLSNYDFPYTPEYCSAVYLTAPTQSPAQETFPGIPCKGDDTPTSHEPTLHIALLKHCIS